MAEISNKSIEKNSILLARNTPVALVVGVAGFIGSFLAEGLIKKRIQVVGVDNFSTGKKENLDELVKDKHFHLINENAQEIDIEVDRLDYIFITAGTNWNLTKILNLAKKYHSKLIFISSIELYDRNVDDFRWYKDSESLIAKFAADNKINTRILRLAAVYGPRMTFTSKDPLVRLIKAALTDQIQKETTVLEFSSRAIFIDDGVSLIIKSVLSGSTAMKIFDGAQLVPIKASEAKQILMDPNWYANKGFDVSDLPPWPTPNLEKTIKFLSWEPKKQVVKTFKETIDYFKDNNIKVSEDKEEEKVAPFFQQPKIKLYVDEEDSSLRNSLLADSDTSKRDHEKPANEERATSKRVDEKTSNKKRLPGFWTIVILVIIGYGLIWPIGVMGWSVYTIRNNFNQVGESLNKGDFKQGLKDINNTQASIKSIDELINLFDFTKNVGFLNSGFQTTSEVLEFASELAEASEHAIKGADSLYQGLKAITGESTVESAPLLKQAEEEFAKADVQLSKLQALTKRDNLKAKLPVFLHSDFAKLQEKLKFYTSLVENGRVAATILPEITATGGKKSYLVLLQNNNELRPTGGFIGSFARVDFEGGKLKKIDVNDIYNIDGLLNIPVAPPKEIKEDLGQQNWFLRDSNWEPDFPTSARQAEWFYTKETGLRVDGVIALDLSAIEDLLSVSGSMDLSDYNETITADNIFERATTHAEQGFFPGSQGKKNFITALSNELFNKLFFAPNQNWPAIVGSLGRSLEQKHLMIYLDNQKLFSYVVSQGWAGALPRPAQQAKEGVTEDFLAVVEANLGANKSNYYLDRNYHLNTVISKEGEINHRLKINYTNHSPSGAWPGGVYKNRMRIYLPFGSKLNRALINDVDVTQQVSPFADYGRAGYSMLVEVAPKQEKTVVLDYQIGSKLSFLDNQAQYNLNVVKQAGLLQDPFEWELIYPINYKIENNEGKNNSPQELIISTDLSTDRIFEVTFKK